MTVTAVVPYDNPLIRQGWTMWGLIQKMPTSFWHPYTGQGRNNIIVQENNISNAATGHTRIYDLGGDLTDAPIKGRTTAYGRGEGKRKFWEQVTVDRYRFPVDNGDIFDATQIGDLALASHQDSMEKLSRKYIKWHDQFFFDALQGNIIDPTNLAATPPTHIFDFGNTFDYNTLIDIENRLSTSTQYNTGGPRTPLESYMMMGDEPCWLLVVDSHVNAKLRMSVDWQKIIPQSDLRGNQNRAIKGSIGKVGGLQIVTAPTSFGALDTTAGGAWDLDSFSIERSGLRRYKNTGTADAPVLVWAGSPEYAASSAKAHSRSLLLGPQAAIYAMGMAPDFKIQKSQDFEITSESLLEIWAGITKVNLQAATQDYVQARVAGLDYGVICVDVQTEV